MANKDKLGDFYTSNNELGPNVTMSFGNSSVNVSINSTSVFLGPNTSVTANGTTGSAGQALTSNGSAVYWSTIVGTNTAAQYVWTNTHTFNANVTFGNSTVNAITFANSSGVYFTGTSYTANNANNLNGKAEAALNVNSATYLATTGNFGNSSGIYSSGVMNAATISVGTSFIANTSQVTISGIPLSANGTTGTAGFVLTTNGSSGAPYWAAAAAGVNTAAQYTWTNTHLFNSNVTVNASFFATTKSFLIDHPTKEGMKLRYGSLEGPENGVYVRGVSDSFVIELPDYWAGLVHANSITVSLTAIGRPQNLYVEKIANNVVYVLNGDYTLPYYHYHIFAERKDVDVLIVEY